MTTLDVWLHGRRVAGVTDEAGRLVLSWAEDLLEHVPAGSPVLSVRLAAQPPSVRPPSALVRAYLGGLLPEVSTSPRSQLARRAGTSSDDVLGLLAVVGGDVAGAARFTAAGSPPAPGGSTPWPTTSPSDGTWNVRVTTSGSATVTPPCPGCSPRRR